jgi:hypothetical protein
LPPAASAWANALWNIAARPRIAWYCWATVLNTLDIAADTSSPAAATTPVVVRAAVTLTSPIDEPSAVTSAAAASTCGNP